MEGLRWEILVSDQNITTGSIGKTNFDIICLLLDYFTSNVEIFEPLLEKRFRESERNIFQNFKAQPGRPSRQSRIR